MLSDMYSHVNVPYKHIFGANDYDMPTIFVLGLLAKVADAE